MQRSWLVIDQEAFFHNVRSLKRLIGSTQLGMVVKANAYGHGIENIAQLVQQAPDVEWLFVAKATEALLLRKRGITKPILVLGLYDAPFEDLIAYDVHLTLYDKALLSSIFQAAQRVTKKALMHLKIDTGLSRLGIGLEEGVDIVKQLQDYVRWCEPVGLFTHLLDTNNPDCTLTFAQLDQFECMRMIMSQEMGPFTYTHALASGSLWLHQRYSYSLVRVGTLLYGFWKTALNKQRLQSLDPAISLKPVLSWKSYVAATFIFQGKECAIIPIGFADGYPQALAQKSWVLINHERANVLHVAPHEMIVDMSKISKVRKGEEVILLGPFAGLQAEDLAHQCGMLPHEFTARIFYYDTSSSGMPLYNSPS